MVASKQCWSQSQLDLLVFDLKYFNEFIVIDHSTTTKEASKYGGKYNKGGDILYQVGNPANYRNKIPVGQHAAAWIRFPGTRIPGAGNILVISNETTWL